MKSDDQELYNQTIHAKLPKRTSETADTHANAKATRWASVLPSRGKTNQQGPVEDPRDHNGPGS